MIDHVAVRQALRTRLLTVSGLPTALAWENRNFQPTNNSPWIREYYYPDPERLVAQDLIEGTGFVSYDVVYPVNSGTEDAEGLADDIKAIYEPPGSLANNLSIISSVRDPGFSEHPWYYVPVRIQWRAHSFI